MKICFLVAAIIFCFTLNASAKLILMGAGSDMEFDASAFPSKMKDAYGLMKAKCLKCHTMERTVVAVTRGVAPITGLKFDKSITQDYGIKHMRKPDADLSKKDVKTIVELLNFLLDEESK